MKNALVAIIIVLVLGGVAYYVINYLGAPAAPESALLTTGTLNPNGTRTQKYDFARALLNINTLKLDFEFFTTDKAWGSLEDFTQPLRDPVRGRKNPFAPLDAGNAAQSGTTTPR